LAWTASCAIACPSNQEPVPTNSVRPVPGFCERGDITFIAHIERGVNVMTDLLALEKAKRAFDRADAAFYAYRGNDVLARNQMAGDRYTALKALLETVDELILAAADPCLI
jgi:hypothetical protein